MRVTHSGGAVFQHDAQQRLGQLIRQSVIGDGVKIPVERVHENVAHAARDLMHRERRGEQGVENGEGRAVERGVETALFACLRVGQNGGVARLAAGCRNGQHNADGHGSCQRRAALPELPDICAGVGRAVGDGLAGVDDAAAADRQNQLRTRFQRQLHALAGQRRARVRLHAAERAILNARLVQKPEHAVKQSTFSSRSSRHRRPARAKVRVFFSSSGSFSVLPAPNTISVGTKYSNPCICLSCDAVCLDYARPFCDLLGQRFDVAVEIARLRRNGHHGAAPGGDRLVNRQYICAAVGKNS